MIGIVVGIGAVVFGIYAISHLARDARQALGSARRARQPWEVTE